ncbi:hypothetical protein [Comamonas composti]|uniref:hypothetical protein n=1 Tax=Comamonas composti TaxID=408558 RepID=UPI0012EC7915|nr:hypothetical protein [Comamonas composti]
MDNSLMQGLGGALHTAVTKAYTFTVAHVCGEGIVKMFQNFAMVNAIRAGAVGGLAPEKRIPC